MKSRLVLGFVAPAALLLGAVLAVADDDKDKTIIVAPPPPPAPAQEVAPPPPPAAVAPASREFVVRRLSDLADGDVHGARGEEIGEIDGLAVDATRGQIAYAVLSFGGMFGVGDKDFAVPWSSLGKRVDASNFEEVNYTLNVDRDQLKNAPGFDRDRWPDLADVSYARQVHTHWNQPLYWEERPSKGVHVHVGPIHVDVEKRREPVLRGEPVAPPPPPAPQPGVAPAVVVKSSELADHDVLDTSGVKFAQLKAVMADPQSGRLVYGILKVTNVSGISDDARYAVPWSLFTVRSKVGGEQQGRVATGRDAFEVIFNAPIDRLRGGPRFNEDAWPNMDQTWGENVYRHYGAQPFWR